ncbi:MAG: DNA mismatch repair protein MutS [Dehalococcoidia bacterium]|nr:MAG: DNA mismatch repair protein MutS [Dehalococcoidia bacterium]
MTQRTTPIRTQYLKIKRSYPQAIVFFRLGDFYETFDEDAKIVSSELEIVLTSREMGKGQRYPMAGIPHHALDNYLARLINKGYKVAICEQVSEPKAGKGIVDREVVRVVTPGTIIEPNLLETKTNNYLVSLCVEGEMAGIAYIDITTSEFATTQIAIERVPLELERLSPSEVLIPDGAQFPQSWFEAPSTELDDHWYDFDTAQQALLDGLGAASLEGYGCAHLPLGVRAAGSILRYLEQTQKGVLEQINSLSTYSTESYMTLDAQTRRNLELFQSSRLGLTSGSLLSVIDLAKTPMGGRLLKKWLGQPPLDIKQLEQRQQVVSCFQSPHRMDVIGLLSKFNDIERLINRVRTGIATPRELVSLRRSLEQIPRLRSELENEADLQWLCSELKPCDDVAVLISQAIVEEPPAMVTDGEVIKSGFSSELDELRSSSSNARRYLAELEQIERSRTGIKSLKVGYNKVFGYYIEVTSPHVHRVPEDYIRKQTLVGAERYFTPQLKEYESLILSAESRITELETAIFRQVCRQVGGWGDRVLSIAAAVAQIDVLCAFAEVAARHGYSRPRLTLDDSITISGGRHPVVELALVDDQFVPNDVYLSNKDAQLIILTGPNMSGKSTYLRQVAIIVLLAQIGSFVPADSATIGLVDRIFTRVGLQDDLVTGQSTFMIEMLETANILNNATSKSLIILDEIGRGTSTYDGLSIAQAVAEFIHNHPRLGAKTLFATHYHELVGLANYLPRVRNLNVAVTEDEGKVVFLRKIIPGGADKSYGIHVAQLAGLPRAVVHRAEEVLNQLENHTGEKAARREPTVRREKIPSEQLLLFGQKPPIIDEILGMDVSSMTPLEAITKLYELQEKAKE